MNAQSGAGALSNPVATREYLASLRGDELLRWRTAPFPGRPSAAERGIDLPLPFGWFAICFSDELAAGQVKAVRYFGRDLALWRGADGRPRMLDAYCRHLGANMAFGGRVHGDYLECPFHSWRYDGAGTVREIPYAKVIPPQARRECVRAWPMEEQNRFVWAWYHPDAVEPLWAVENFPETLSPQWTEYEKHEWLVYCPLQTMAENGVDVAHFRYLHGTASYPDWVVSMHGHRRETTVKAKMETPRGTVDGAITAGVVGPGQPWTRFTGICETLLVTGCTPVEKDTVHLRFAFTQQRADREGARAGVARAIIKDICRQLDQDKVVWDRQHHIARPLLCDGDGPIPAFREFFSQFYAEWHRESGPKVMSAKRMERRARS
jgi:3-ketosteroid 9alpha-monooxygenase subunit A